MTHHTGSDEGLSEAEVRSLYDALWDTGCHGWMGDHPELVAAVEHILAARAAAPDALRERVEALAAEWERDARAIPRTMSQVSEGVRAAMNGCARDLRAALAEWPTDGAGT